MDQDFWLQCWQTNQIGFHKSKAHPMLVKHFGQLSLRKNSRIFLPLCGKTLDIGWLQSQGYRVVGAELSELAIEQFFQELQIEPVITKAGEMRQYSTPEDSINIFVGDIFRLSPRDLGAVDATYDRAALVALPLVMRRCYTKHLRALTQNAPQLLITFEYDQSQKSGPPFSISSAEIAEHYNMHYSVSRLSSKELSGGLKGNVAATENVWLLDRL